MAVSMPVQETPQAVNDPDKEVLELAAQQLNRSVRRLRWIRVGMMMVFAGLTGGFAAEGNWVVSVGCLAMVWYWHKQRPGTYVVMKYERRDND